MQCVRDSAWQNYGRDMIAGHSSQDMGLRRELRQMATLKNVTSLKMTSLNLPRGTQRVRRSPTINVALPVYHSDET